MNAALTALKDVRVGSGLLIRTLQIRGANRWHKEFLVCKLEGVDSIIDDFVGRDTNFPQILKTYISK